MDLIRWYKEAKEVIKEAVGDEGIIRLLYVTKLI